MRAILCLLVGLLFLQAVQAAEQPHWAQQWSHEFVDTPMSEGAAAIASLAVIVDGEIVLLEGYGTQAGPGGEPIDPQNDNFLIASITKTFTALAIAQLLDDGEIKSLDDPANQYLERIQLPAYAGVDVRVRDLLALPFWGYWWKISRG